MKFRLANMPAANGPPKNVEIAIARCEYSGSVSVCKKIFFFCHIIHVHNKF
jgi:hypothetical protein